ncbi:MAG: glycosyltransferase family 4 protein, partial [Candidatus Omnitrophica bacterium]|nr:glycosyltransferase family 4 protein [Candidatus Omnitrophota bacterium]
HYFAKHLLQAGVDVEIIAPLDDGRPRTEYFEGIQYTLIEPCISSYLELPVGWLGVHWFARNLARYLKDKPFDILHSFDMTGLYYLDVPGRKPVIAHIFSDNYLCNPITVIKYLSLFGYKPHDIKKTKIALSPFAGLKTIAQYPAQYFFKTRPMHRYLAGCERVFLEDEYFREEVVRLFRLDPAKVRIIPVGVDVGYAHKQMEAAALTRAQLGFSKDDLILLTVNRLAADKGIDQIILALKTIRLSIPAARLLIVGKGYQEPELLSLIASSGLAEHVRLFQDVREEDLYAYYKISDLYLCAFSFSGSSISTLEAMAAGLPVVTTAQPWLIPAGRNGVFIPDNQPSTIARSVLVLAAQDLKAKGAASADIVKDHDWPQIARRAQGLYQKILSNS